MNARLLKPCLVALAWVLAGSAALAQETAQTNSSGTAPAVTFSKHSVNINTATPDELRTLPAIGPTYASRIIQGRPYESIDDMRRAGVPARVIARLRGRAALSGPTRIPSPATDEAPIGVTEDEPAPSSKTKADAKANTKAQAVADLDRDVDRDEPEVVGLIDLNMASLVDLEALPGIGPTRAKAIIDGRPYHKIEDVKNVPGIKDGLFAKIKSRITVK